MCASSSLISGVVTTQGAGKPAILAISQWTTECFGKRIPDWPGKKSDRSDQESDSLNSILIGIVRYLQFIGNEYDILKSSEFHTSKKVLDMRHCRLKQTRKGKRPNHGERLCAEQDDRPWLSGQPEYWQWGESAKLPVVFCHQTPVIQGFSRGETIAVGDLKLHEDENIDVLEFMERETKIRTGNNDPRSFAPKMFPKVADPSMCPLKF